MSGFAAEWLALREPADAAARDAGVLAHLGLSRDAPAGLAVIDLGAGAGANLRWLAPRLPRGQRWVLVDHDAALLELAASGGTRASRPAADPEVDVRQLDLAVGLGELELPPGALVTASALLDLVSQNWLSALAARCAAAAAPVLFALTYDGDIEAQPAEAGDDMIRRLVNRHQRGDKGFGPALGPAAAAAAARTFTDCGYRIHGARSDWHLGPRQADLQRALITGWADAALEAEPAQRDAIARWQSRRLAHVAAGRSRIRVGHVDVAGRPDGR